ncbi:oligosaccharide flippase family protein [Oryzobacter telluris]|uniref:oligosaccharide flippase family protein n=1 Tax=Oryzobacter telluris TaxID=3149179 RepID=UPI00370DB9C2
MTQNERPARERAVEAAHEPSDPGTVDDGGGRASARVVRGGVLRTFGYGVGALANVAGSVLLLRYLGVEQFGSYAVVTSLVALAGGLADGGLTAVGNRELAVRGGRKERRLLMSQLLGIRLLVTPVAMALAVLFALAAGYPALLVLGTLLAGLGWIVSVAASALAMPLSVELRIGALTALDLLKSLGATAAIVVLVLIGAGLLPFFAAAVPTAVVAVLVTPRLLAKGSLGWPTLRLRESGELVRKSLIMALATVVGAVYLRLLTLLVFQLSDETQTGLFGTSARILEAITGLPLLVFLVALPVMSLAYKENRNSLRRFFQRMVEVSTVVTWFFVTVLVVGAEPIILAVGGAEYAQAIPVLQVQSLALVGALLAMASTMAAIAMDLDASILRANATALGCAFVLGIPAVLLWGALGAAVATVAGDLAMAAVYWVALGRADAQMRPRLRHTWKALVAAMAAVVVATVAPVGDLVATGIAAAVFVAVALVTRAVPAEVFDALRHRGIGGGRT